jgi:hypothetical protein
MILGHGMGYDGGEGAMIVWGEAMQEALVEGCDEMAMFWGYMGGGLWWLGAMDGLW